MNLTCCACKLEELIDGLSTAEAAGWGWSVRGWVCASCRHIQEEKHESQNI